jgi:glutamyl-tRNA synthetase
VEDTDAERVRPEHYQTIEDDLSWMGLDWDEGPIRQSDRLETYREAAEKLIELGAAFRCYCTPDELAAKREKARAEGRPTRYDGRCLTNPPGGDRWVVRLHVPAEGETAFEDIVTGPVTFHHDQLDHVVLVRSDGTPLYNLAATVDDGTMNITHVVRGIDLQSSTPYQIIMLRALGHEIPSYGHLPLINDVNGKPLSKRKDSSSLLWYRENGYIPEAMVNYLALQGWGSGDESLFTRDELIEKFELEHVHASPANFDLARLEWMNGEHIRMLSDADLAERLRPYFEKEGWDTSSQDIVAIASLVKTRIRRMDEAPALVRGIFMDDVQPDAETIEKVLRADHVAKLLETSIEKLSGLKMWDRESIQGALYEVVDQMQLKRKVAFRPFYVAIHGAPVGAPLFESMEMIGQEKTLERLKKTSRL